MIKRIELELPTILTILTLSLGLAFQSCQQNNQLNGRMDALNDALNGRIDALDDALNGRMDALDGRMDAFDARLRAVEQSQVRITTLLEKVTIPQVHKHGNSD